jgi:hypothetical protein
MQQAKFSLTPPLVEFLGDYQTYGFKDRSSMVRIALQRFREELELQSLKQSANLYAEIYEQDEELHELTEAAIQDWPE